METPATSNQLPDEPEQPTDQDNPGVFDRLLGAAVDSAERVITDPVGVYRIGEDIGRLTSEKR